MNWNNNLHLLVFSIWDLNCSHNLSFCLFKLHSCSIYESQSCLLLYQCWVKFKLFTQSINLMCTIVQHVITQLCLALPFLSTCASLQHKSFCFYIAICFASHFHFCTCQKLSLCAHFKFLNANIGKSLYLKFEIACSAFN